MTPHRTRVILLVIVLIALALRCWGALSAPPPQKDGKEHELLAISLAAGHGFTFDGASPTASRPPGYPVFIAAIYKTIGVQHLAVKVIECLIGALTCLLIFALAQRLFGERAALLASACWAINPLAWDSYFSAGTFCMETVAASLLIAMMAAIWKSFTSKATGWSVAAGLLLGLLLVTKASLIMLPLFLAPLWILQAYQLRSWRPLLKAILTGAVCLACLAPWIYRNYEVFDAFIPASTSGGLTFYRSNNEISDGGHNYPKGGEKKYTELGEVDRSKRYYAEGKTYLREHADNIPWLIYRKNRLLMDPFYESQVLTREKTINLWFVILAPLGLTGFLMTLRQHGWWTLIVLAAIAELVVVTSMFHGYARYRFPYEPLLCVYAAAAIREIVLRFRGAHHVDAGGANALTSP